MCARSWCRTSSGSRRAISWWRSSTTTTARRLTRRREMSRRAQAAIATIEQQKVLQGALIEQAEATIAASEADLTRYHLETVRQQALLATQHRRHAPDRRAGRRQREACRGDARAQPGPARSAARAGQRAGQPGNAGAGDADGATGGARSGARSILATRASPRRSTAWSASGRCRPANTSTSGRR